MSCYDHPVGFKKFNWSDFQWGKEGEQQIRKYLQAFGTVEYQMLPSGLYDEDGKIIILRNSEKWYVEIERRRKYWLKGTCPFPFTTVHIPGRRIANMMKKREHKWIYFLLSADMTAFLEYEDILADLINTEADTANTSVSKNEQFAHLPIDKWTKKQFPNQQEFDFRFSNATKPH